MDVRHSAPHSHRTQSFASLALRTPPLVLVALRRVFSAGFMLSPPVLSLRGPCRLSNWPNEWFGGGAVTRSSVQLDNGCQGAEKCTTEGDAGGRVGCPGDGSWAPVASMPECARA